MGLLSKTPTIPRQNLEEYNILIFSEAGFGKTSFMSEFNKCSLVLFENSAKSLMSNDTNLNELVSKLPQYKHEWEVFKDVVTEFNEGNHDFNTIAVDTATRAYDKAMTYMVEEELHGLHPSEMMKDNDSSGYSLLNGELKEWFGKLLNNDYGTIISAHAKYKDVKDVRGNKRKQLVPDTGGSFGRWLMGEVDIIIFLDKNEDGERIFRLEGTKDFNAKQRLHFENDIIKVENDNVNAGKYAYEKFKEEFDKAIDLVNKEYGITDEMIEQYYSNKQKENKIVELQNKIIDYCKNNNIPPSKNKVLLDEQLGISSVREINEEKDAKEYLSFLKNEA